MEPHEIFSILNRRIFETEKAYLIRNIAENPERFLGVFRSTTPRLKLIQNVLQSREIRFGDALEDVVRQLLAEAGYVNMPEREVTLKTPKGRSKNLAFDQYFTSPDKSRVYLVEQKVRDDHDSSKKTGQVENFKRKLLYLKEKHADSLVGIMYFIDPMLKKNLGYYEVALAELREELDVPIYLFYNGAFFEHLTGSMAAWDNLASALLSWRDSVPTDVNLDCDVLGDLEELVRVEPIYWYKLVVNEPLWSSGVVKCIFPNGTNLRQVSLRFAQTGSRKFSVGRRKVSFRELAELIQQQVRHRYGIQYDLPNSDQQSLL